MTTDSKELLASVERDIEAKILQLEHYRDNDCQLDHARTIAEGRILQARMDMNLIHKARQAPPAASPADPKPAPDAMRERLRQEVERKVALAVSDGEYLGRNKLPPKEEIEVRETCIRDRTNAIMALSAPAPSPDGTAGTAVDYSDEVTVEQINKVDDLVKGEFETGNWVTDRPSSDDVRSALAEPRFQSLRSRLLHAITTASNDDLSEPMSEKRDRHVERISTMYVAIDFIEAALRSAPVSAPALPRHDGGRP